MRVYSVILKHWDNTREDIGSALKALVAVLWNTQGFQSPSLYAAKFTKNNP